MKKEYTLIHDSAQQRYLFEFEDGTAVIDYRLNGTVITLTHTGVPARYEGQGVGSALVRAVLDDIRDKGLQIIPQCSFIAQYIFRHPQYEELVVTEVGSK